MRLSHITAELAGAPLPTSATGDTIDERIAACFAGSPTSNEIAALLTDVRTADAEAQQDYVLASERALDPSTPADEVQDARRAIDDAQFRRDRLAVAAKRLDELRIAKVREEEQTAHDRRVAEVTSRRDAMVKELRERYPTMVNDLADLLRRLTAVDAEANALRLDSAENIARHGTIAANQPTTPLARCRLVDFERRYDAFIWADGASNDRGRRASALPSDAPSQSPVRGPQYIEVPTLRVEISNETRGQRMFFYNAGNSTVWVNPGETVSSVILSADLEKVRENFRVDELGAGEPARRLAS